jgi:hypothetical protein
MSALGQKQTFAVHQPMSALPPKATLIGAHLGLLTLHHNLGSDRHAAVEVGNVLVDHAEASRRHSLADRLRRIGAVDAIHGAPI